MIISAVIALLGIIFFFFNPTLLVNLFIALSLWDEAMGISATGNLSITRLVGIAILARWLLDHIGSKRKKFPALTRSAKLGFVFICIAGLSFFWSQYPDISLERFITLFQLWILMVIVPVYLLGEKKLDQVAITISLVSSLMAVVVFQNYRNGIGFLDEQSLLRGMVSAGFDANIAATTMLMGFALSIGLIVFGEKKSVKFIGILTTVFTLFGIVLTLSRTSIISAALLVLVFLYSVVRTYGLKASHVLAMVITVAGFALIINQTQLANSLIMRMDTIVNPVAVNPRTEIWKVAIYSIQQSPLFGIGLGTFSAQYTYYQQLIPNLERVWYTGRDVHNVYLEILAETGAIGFFAYIAFLVSLMIDMNKSRVNIAIGKLNSGIFLSVLLSAIALLINSFFLPLLFRKILWLIPLFITTLLLQTENEKDGDAVKPLSTKTLIEPAK